MRSPVVAKDSSNSGSYGRRRGSKLVGDERMAIRLRRDEEQIQAHDMLPSKNRSCLYTRISVDSGSSER